MAKQAMTDEHKAAITRGRELSKPVRAYLSHIETLKPRRVRPRNAEALQTAIDATDRKIEMATTITKLD